MLGEGLSETTTTLPLNALPPPLNPAPAPKTPTPASTAGA
jgi:hypothetical protein